MKKFLVFVIVLGLLVGSSSVALAAKPGGEQERLNNVLVLAADHHLSLQDTYNTWIHPVWGSGPIPNTWEWVIGSGSSGWNVQGISATGLLAAYEQTDRSDYLDGAVLAGDTLVNRYESYPNQRTYSQDIEFLVRLSQDSEDDSYADTAGEWYAVTMNAFNAEQLADYYIADRGFLAGWDLASQIRAAVAIGETDYAAGIASRLIERKADWDSPYLGGWDYGSLLWAFAELNDNSFNDYVGEIRDILLGSQGEDGSWDNDYQSTAYAILGLTADGTAKGAQTKAWAFLRDTQTSIGGWSYPPELGEVNSEVIMALGSLDLKDVKAGHTDPQPGRGKDTGRHKLDPAL